MKRLQFILSVLVSWALAVPVMAATQARGAAGVIAQSSKASVRQKVAANNLYDQACYDAYFGCMDQFCMSDNESGGSCICSSDYSQYETRMKKVEADNAEANRLSTIEVEKVKAGSDADILFTGKRQYDDSGEVVESQQKSTTKRRTQIDIESMFGDGQDVSLEGRTGKDLYDGARTICLEQVPENCESDMSMLTQVYLTQVKNDCSALSSVIGDLEKKSQTALLDAESAVRTARDEKKAVDNEYDRGTCMVEFKKCMKTEDACGSDWNRCVSSVASENMQNNSAVSTRGTRISHTEKFEITDSVAEMLSSKRTVCERVLNKCMATRNFVWDDFLRDVAPELKDAELKAEANKRQSCLTDISDCIQVACKDDIVGKGQATMDACLARPDMARSFCKVQIDPCERMEPQIWDYVVSKLAALRVDVCTNEVKECFTSDDRCGSDFSNCIGMDYDYLHDMCPIDKLVVCKQANPNFKMADIDDMLMGFFLNVDNSALDLCQGKIDKKMTEICGSTTDCNKFAADDNFGTGSLQSVKIGNIYRISGMLSFGMIKMGNGSACDGVSKDGSCDKDNVLPVGKIGVDDYINEIRAKYPNVSDQEIIATIEMELRNIEGTINRTIDAIESDQEIQYCISGRDLSQINGRSGRNNKTTARFPNLMNNQKQLIAASALKKAQDNYNKKYNDMVAKATKEASADIAQYMCHKMGSSGEGGGKVEAGPDLVPPYSIKIEIGQGISLAQLAGQGNTGNLSQSVGNASTRESQAGISLANIGYQSSGTSVNGNVTRNTRSLFSRESRNCHYCSETITTSCSSSKSKGFFGIGAKSKSSCSTETSGEKCEDIQM